MAATISLLLASAAAQAAAAAPIDGRWINPKDNVIILIAPCGDSYCGTVEWASAKARAKARKGVDELIGARLLTDAVPSSESRWKGKLFIPDKQMRASVNIDVLDARRLKLSGCVLGGLLCKSQIWTRTDAPAHRQD